MTFNVSASLDCGSSETDMSHLARYNGDALRICGLGDVVASLHEGEGTALGVG